MKPEKYLHFQTYPRLNIIPPPMRSNKAINRHWAQRLVSLHRCWVNYLQYREAQIATQLIEEQNRSETLATALKRAKEKLKSLAPSSDPFWASDAMHRASRLSKRTVAGFLTPQEAIQQGRERETPKIEYPDLPPIKIG
jgi:hypothetical protein